MSYAVDIKLFIKHLNSFCKVSLETSLETAVACTHYEVTVEHMLKEIIKKKNSDVYLLLQSYNVNVENFIELLDGVTKQFRIGNGARPVFSPRLIEWFQDAVLISTLELNESYVRSGSLFIAFLKKPLTLSSSSQLTELIQTLDINVVLKTFFDLTKKSIERKITDSSDGVKKTSSAGYSAINKFCEDFTKKAGEGKIDPIFGRDEEVRQMIDVLARRKKNNPIVVGEAGVGKTALVEGLALRIINKDVPNFLKNVSIMSLDLGILQAGAGVKGVFEQRLKEVIEEVKTSIKPIVLFIDEAHTMIGAGAAAGQSDAANLLKPALARGELRTIAATTWSEYKKYFEKDAALTRRFQPIYLDEPSVETTTLILRGLKERYEKAHGVFICDEAIVSASVLSNRYLSGRYLPDKAIDLLDTSAARVKIMLTDKPSVVEALEHSIKAYEREKTALERDIIHSSYSDSNNRLDYLNNTIEKLRYKLDLSIKKWNKERELATELITYKEELFNNNETVKENISEIQSKLKDIQKESSFIHTEVNKDMISEVISNWTGIPSGKIMQNQVDSIISLESEINKVIIGQDSAISTICKTIKSSQAQLRNPNQPGGVFFLVGPSGVGKTETGLTIAKYLFGEERFAVTVNLSEFAEKHTISRLIGSPPGYVGYGEGGILTEAVRKRPYSVILLDEAEKAHPQVMNLFYQVFDKGLIADGEGREIDFKNTIIFLTSNIASRKIVNFYSQNKEISAKKIIEEIYPQLEKHFKPALLARMSLIPYAPLDIEALSKIASIKMNQLSERIASIHGIDLEYTSNVCILIVEHCKATQTFARNIDSIINEKILPKIASNILTVISEDKLINTIHIETKKNEFVISLNK